MGKKTARATKLWWLPVGSGHRNLQITRLKHRKQNSEGQSYLKSLAFAYSGHTLKRHKVPALEGSVTY
jgi:hypothetical protein